MLDAIKFLSYSDVIYMLRPQIINNLVANTCKILSKQRYPAGSRLDDIVGQQLILCPGLILHKITPSAIASFGQGIVDVCAGW